MTRCRFKNLFAMLLLVALLLPMALAEDLQIELELPGDAVQEESVALSDDLMLDTLAVDVPLETGEAPEESGAEDDALYGTFANEMRVRIDSRHFPDAVFRNVVKYHYDGDGDGWLSRSEAAGVEEMKVENNGECFSLRGIEFFVNLRDLYCHGNSLKFLDLSKNRKLVSLDCSDNKLKKLDLSRNTSLENLSCEENDLVRLDVSRCKKLEILSCYDNHLTGLDISALNALEFLHAEDNEMEVLDITGSPTLASMARFTPSILAGDARWSNDGGYPYHLTLDEDILLMADGLVLYGKATVQLAETSVTLGVGEKFSLLPVVIPAEAADSVRFKSSNRKIAKVDEKSGKITAKRIGYATISAVIAGNVVAICEVTVQSAPKKVTLNRKSKTMTAGETLQLTATLSKGAAYDVDWTSSNKKVAIVDQNGLVTAIKKGKATITAKVFNGRKATCKISVTQDGQSDRINLAYYIGKDVDWSGKALGLECYDPNMHYYGNDCVEIGTYSEYSTNWTDYIYLSIDPLEKYCFGDFYLGMEPEKARKLLTSEGWSAEGVSDNRAFYSKRINGKLINLTFSPYYGKIQEIYCSLTHEEAE